MNAADAPSAQQKYYDPDEVETYVRDVTNTIEALQARLQQALKRAERAEKASHQGSGELHPDTASLGRALLLAGEVADKTIADADIRAAEIVRSAELRAAAIVDAARGESRRLVEAAGDTAAEVFEKGEARLLAAVSAFVEGSNVLRTALARIDEDATSWRRSLRPPQSAEPARTSGGTTTIDSAPNRPSGDPVVRGSLDDATTSPKPPARLGGVHDRAGSNGFRSTASAADPALGEPPSPKATPNPSYPPAPPPPPPLPPQSGRPDDHWGNSTM